MKMQFVKRILIVGVLLTLSAGCGEIDEAARQKQARAMLVSLRRSVDLNGPMIPDVEVGDPAPVTVGVDVQGERIALADYSGQVILLSFWGGG